MSSIIKIASILSLISAVAVKGTSKPAYGKECQDYYYGECIPCKQEMYWDGLCHNEPNYPEPQNPGAQYPVPQRPMPAYPMPVYPKPQQPIPVVPVPIPNYPVYRYPMPSHHKSRYPAPYYPEPSNPCKSGKGLLGMDIGVGLGSFLGMDLRVDSGKCQNMVNFDAKVDI
ncbi:hypothetical protein DSO57_1025920 [Entomophthora muscae]|uniref:Uncharacterized protein n=1 Tax=Entomophthora muscae TaxID=34485 RepID=A0ACC2RT55_9FUNG|nr:hypothetical protein DSO57_1025920 [Entomophthora muscae]